MANGKQYRKKRAMATITGLLKMGTPFNVKKVSFETLQAAQNLGRITRKEMVERPEAGADTTQTSARRRRKRSYFA